VKYFKIFKNSLDYKKKSFYELTFQQTHIFLSGGVVRTLAAAWFWQFEPTNTSSL